MDKSKRSVFGNIPYEANVDDLKEVFNQAGPVTSFRIVNDRESGRSKGYGFCEYSDEGTALSAMRNLNNFVFRGRRLRVDYACPSHLEAHEAAPQPRASPPRQRVYGEPVAVEEAPAAVQEVVDTLCPERALDTLAEVQASLRSHPGPARAYLLRNPQLAFALLKTLQRLRLVDPELAESMLSKEAPPGVGTGDDDNDDAATMTVAVGAAKPGRPLSEQLMEIAQPEVALAIRTNELWPPASCEAHGAVGPFAFPPPWNTREPPQLPPCTPMMEDPPFHHPHQRALSADVGIPRMQMRGFPPEEDGPFPHPCDHQRGPPMQRRRVSYPPGPFPPF